MNKRALLLMAQEWCCSIEFRSADDRVLAVFWQEGQPLVALFLDERGQTEWSVSRLETQLSLALKKVGWRKA
jgi:hypothetical protein